MKTDVQKVSSCRVKVIVEATAEEIDPIMKGVRSAFTAQVKIPGFRPGKAPWAQIEKLYGKNIQEEINQRVTRTLVDKAYAEVKNIATLVNVEDFKAAQGQGASVAVTIDTIPEFDMPDIAKWQVKKMNLDVTEEEIAERMDSLRQMAASFEEGTAEDVATESDLIAITFTSDLDKETLSDAAKHYAADDEYWVQLREDAFIPALSTVLLGKKIGETVTHSATYAEDFRLTDLAGKTVNYTITIKTMRKMRPATDESMLTRFGVKDMDELRTNLTGNIKDSKKYGEESRATKELCEAIENSVSFDLPQRVLEERVYDELAMDPSKPLETFNGDADELRKSDVYKAAEERAIRMLRRTYVLTRLAKERDVKLSQERVEVALDRLAQATKLAKKELIRRLSDNGRLTEFLDRELCAVMLETLLEECAVL
ncbi:MAG: trigger factor [Kiritimatiellae bacterium]|nr:trigger factor [Kiritimatiellia bacterium]